jgi:lipocalin
MLKTSLIILAVLMPFISSIWSFWFCPGEDKYKPMKDFNAQLYNGTWYEILTSEEKSDYSCIIHNYVITPDNNIRDNLIVWDNTNKRFMNQTESLLKRDNKPYQYKKNVFTVNIVDIDYIILDTDYNNYAIAYACYNSAFVNFRYAWVLSRTRMIDQPLMTKISSIVLDRTGIDKLYNITTCKP